ncbi:MAG: YnfA family protein [Leptospirillum sp.]|jgi:small multidrug resistance family-3 protein|nr:YnfA family protein [Nitrospiraceae bacterium]MDA8150338.1 YnfA family protein [Nitrospiraceae bacterium]
MGFLSGLRVLVQTLPWFVLSGILEVGGGYLVWRWLREQQSPWQGVAGMIILALYGISATKIPAPFGRVYAAYGGVFIVVSIFWAMAFDHFSPDGWDKAGAVLVLFGVGMMILAPRG